MRKAFTFLLAVALCAQMQAKELTESEALDRAVSSMHNGFRRAPSKACMSLAYTADKSYFVFNSGVSNGFMIVSADDRLPALLGYTDNGSFDYETMPPNLKWWMSEYDNEIKAYLATNPAETPAMASIVADSRAVIEPMVTTQWNQSTPYNDDCPVKDGSRCVTGCVATAIAQIINYHQWPKGTGQGSYSYTWNNQENLSVNFAETSFNWDLLNDTYDNFSSTKSKAEVAKLMYACGVGLHANFGLDGSGAFNFAVPHLLAEYLDYSKSATILKRSTFSSSEWDSVIYGELSEGRPVYYSGAAPNGGHAFVCDGYAGNGYYHINWGWGGLSDGYFRLSVLNPDNQGIGSFEGGYNTNQEAIINIMPQDGASALGYIYSKGECNWTDNYVKLTNVFVDNIGDLDINLGLEIVNDADGTTSSFFNNNNVHFSSCDPATGAYSGYGALYIYLYDFPKNLKPGTYKLYPAYKNSDGERYGALRMTYGQQQYVLLTVGEDGSQTFSNPGVEFQNALEAISFGCNDKVYRNTTASFGFSVKNFASDEYSEAISVAVFKDGEELDRVHLDVTIAAISTYSGSFDHAFDLEPATYEVYLLDSTGKPLNNYAFELIIEEGSEPAPGLYVLSVSPDGYYKNLSSTLYIQFSNTSAETISTPVWFKFYKKGESNFVKGFGINLNIESKATPAYAIGDVSLGDLPFGEYELRLTDGNDKELCSPVALSQYDIADGIWYGSAEAGLAMVVTSPEPIDAEDGLIDIPAQITIDGTSYEVSAIGEAAFANYTGLKNLILRSQIDLASGGPRPFNGLDSSVDVYVPSAAYNDFETELAKRGNQVYALIESLSCHHLSGEPHNITEGDDHVFAIDFEPSENINRNLSLSIDDESLMSFVIGEQARISSNAVTVTAHAHTSGQGTITVSSSQPGLEELSIPVTINKRIPTGMTGVGDGGVRITAANGSIDIEGLNDGDMIKVYNATGSTIYQSRSTAVLTRITGLAPGLYIVKAGDLTSKLAL